MRNKLFIASYLFMMIFILNVIATAQEKSDPTLIASSPGRFSAAFKTKEEPDRGSNTPTSELRFDSTAIHRVWVDKKAGTYFGYDLQIEPMPNGRTFRLSFGPLSVPAYVPSNGARVGARAGSSNGPASVVGFRQLGTMRFPDPLEIEDGDTVSLDVLINPQTGVKLIDLITVSAYGQSANTSGAIGPPHEFRLEDIAMTVQRPQVLINGKVAAGDESGVLSCTGELLYFYLMGRGRFVFSIKPHDDYGFQKIGEIKNNKISFTLDGDYYEWISIAPILTTGGNWTMWVLHDTDYRPDKDQAGAPKYTVGALNGVKALRPE